MRAPSFFSDPHVQFLSQLMEEIEAGYLQVPRFQRPLVWKWERRRELLRSIRDGIPIGAIMVWRTTSTEVECYSKLGPHKLNLPESAATRSYLLDGVQRLSTLYGALHSPAEMLQTSDRADDIIPYDDDLPSSEDFEVFVDLETRDFYVAGTDDTTGMMPLTMIFDSVALLRFQRQLLGNGLDAKVDVADEIVGAFRSYKIPIIPITTDDVDLATRTFQRINSQGAKMSEAHMVHALTWSVQFDLQKQLAELRAELLSDIGWEDIDDDPILKSIKASFELDVYKTNAQDLSEALKSSPETVRKVMTSIRHSATFLRDYCGIPSVDFIPYSLQIVMLSRAFSQNPEPSERVRELLRSWFWVSTYGEVFAGITGDRTRIALEDISMIASMELPVWTWKRPYEHGRLSKTFDFRAARAKAFAFQLAHRQNEVGQDNSGTQILADGGRKALVQLLPYSRANRAVFSSPGNRFLVHPHQAGELKERLVQDRLTMDDRLRHFLTDRALSALDNSDEEGFVTARLESIAKAEKKFLEPMLAPFLRGEAAEERDLFSDFEADD